MPLHKTPQKIDWETSKEILGMIVLSDKNNATSKISSKPPVYFPFFPIFYHSKVIYSSKIEKNIHTFIKFYDIMSFR